MKWEGWRRCISTGICSVVGRLTLAYSELLMCEIAAEIDCQVYRSTYVFSFQRTWPQTATRSLSLDPDGGFSLTFYHPHRQSVDLSPQTSVLIRLQSLSVLSLSATVLKNVKTAFTHTVNYLYAAGVCLATRGVHDMRLDRSFVQSFIRLTRTTIFNYFKTTRNIPVSYTHLTLPTNREV